MNLIKYISYKSLIIPVLLTILMVVLSYFLNSQIGIIYDGIQKYEEQKVWTSIAWFCGLAGVFVIVYGYAQYYQNIFSVSLRNSLYEGIKGQISVSVDNFDQRLQEDTKRISEYFSEILFSIFYAALKLPLFIGVIASLTSIWISMGILLAVIVGTVLTRWITGSLIVAQSEWESEEASLRVQIRKEYPPTLEKVIEKFNKFNQALKRLTFLQSGIGQVFTLLPFILLLPLYFSKVINLGIFLQSVNALDKVISSLSVLIDKRNVIAAYSTSKKRLEEVLK